MEVMTTEPNAGQQRLMSAELTGRTLRFGPRSQALSLPVFAHLAAFGRDEPAIPLVLHAILARRNVWTSLQF
jgi:hypothetical protein